MKIHLRHLKAWSFHLSGQHPDPLMLPAERFPDILLSMKTGIHPNYIDTKVHCNGCNTTFQTHSTVPEITVEICSNCHPFYTGKQKLIDTAGRVDKFNARRSQAEKLKSKSKPKAPRKGNSEALVEDSIEKIEAELATETVDIKQLENNK